MAVAVDHQRLTPTTNIEGNGALSPLAQHIVKNCDKLDRERPDSMQRLLNAFQAEWGTALTKAQFLQLLRNLGKAETNEPTIELTLIPALRRAWPDILQNQHTAYWRRTMSAVPVGDTEALLRKRRLGDRGEVLNIEEIQRLSASFGLRVAVFRGQNFAVNHANYLGIDFLGPRALSPNAPLAKINMLDNGECLYESQLKELKEVKARNEFYEWLKHKANVAKISEGIGNKIRNASDVEKNSLDLQPTFSDLSKGSEDVNFLQALGLLGNVFAGLKGKLPPFFSVLMDAVLAISTGLFAVEKKLNDISEAKNPEQKFIKEQLNSPNGHKDASLFYQAVLALKPEITPGLFAQWNASPGSEAVWNSLESLLRASGLTNELDGIQQHQEKALLDNASFEAGGLIRPNFDDLEPQIYDAGGEPIRPEQPKEIYQRLLEDCQREGTPQAFAVRKEMQRIVKRRQQEAQPILQRRKHLLDLRDAIRGEVDDAQARRDQLAIAAPGSPALAEAEAALRRANQRFVAQLLDGAGALNGPLMIQIREASEELEVLAGDLAQELDAIDPHYENSLANRLRNVEADYGDLEAELERVRAERDAALAAAAGRRPAHDLDGDGDDVDGDPDLDDGAEAEGDAPEDEDGFDAAPLHPPF